MKQTQDKKKSKEAINFLKEEHKLIKSMRANIELLRGWPQIKNFCGLKCDNRTMKRLAEKYFLPVYYEHGRPRVRRTFLTLWMIEIQKQGFHGKERTELERLRKDLYEKMEEKRKRFEKELSGTKQEVQLELFS